MNKELNGITYQDLINKQWAELPKEPDFPPSFIEQFGGQLLESKGAADVIKLQAEQSNVPNETDKKKVDENNDLPETVLNPIVNGLPKTTFSAVGTPLFQFPFAASNIGYPFVNSQQACKWLSFALNLT